MLSICIPIYNRDCTALVGELISQAVADAIEIELILIDDASSERMIKRVNETLSQSKKVVYVELEQNIGRAAIRNLLANKAKYDYLLFLDCDVWPYTKSFIVNYCRCIEAGKQVVVGGRQYREEEYTPQTKLHYRYGSKRESKLAEYRNKHPYDAFVTGNFLIRKEIIQKVKFEDKLKQYGRCLVLS
jgi:glycosyltransferase involved in cell wall biosynthesis